MKTVLVVAESFHWYGQTDGHEKLNCRYLQFCKNA